MTITALLSGETYVRLRVWLSRRRGGIGEPALTLMAPGEYRPLTKCQRRLLFNDFSGSSLFTPTLIVCCFYPGLLLRLPIDICMPRNSASSLAMTLSIRAWGIMADSRRLARKPVRLRVACALATIADQLIVMRYAAAAVTRPDARYLPEHCG